MPFTDYSDFTKRPFHAHHTEATVSASQKGIPHHFGMTDQKAARLLNKAVKALHPKKAVQPKRRKKEDTIWH